MRFYITKESEKNIKNTFTNIKGYFFIDIDELKKKFENIEDENCFEFLLNENIKEKINQILQKKRITNIIYLNKNLNLDTVKNIKEIFENSSKIEKFVFIDKKEENEYLYPLFDEIVLIPKQRKIKILECEKIKNPMYYWINNFPVPDILKNK